MYSASSLVPNRSLPMCKVRICQGFAVVRIRRKDDKPKVRLVGQAKRPRYALISVSKDLATDGPDAADNFERFLGTSTEGGRCGTCF